jgi:hypothetical protein
MDMSTVQRRSGELRRAIVDGRTVPLTFRDKQFATVLPSDVLEQLVELAGDAGRQLISTTSAEAAVA